MTDNEIIKALEHCRDNGCAGCPFEFMEDDKGCMTEWLALINRQREEIERLIVDVTTYRLRWAKATAKLDTAKAEAIKEFAEKVDELLKRYSHLHKYAEEARRTEEEYADGTPMEMVSVWEVLTLKKWEMCDYETMTTLQENIEVIEKARLLSEIERDFELLKKEMVGANK